MSDMMRMGFRINELTARVEEPRRSAGWAGGEGRWRQGSP